MRLGIIGAGLIVNTLLQFIHEVDVELIAISATPQEIDKLNQLKAEHGFKYVYTDIDDLLKNEEIDTVYLGVNNQLHYLFGKKVLEANKNLIMEKPFSSNYDQARKLCDMAKERNLFIFEAISFVTMPGAETPTKMSAPLRASASVPVFCSGFVTSIIFSCILLRSGDVLERIPDLSHIVTLVKP